MHPKSAFIVKMKPGTAYARSEYIVLAYGWDEAVNLALAAEDRAAHGEKINSRVLSVELYGDADAVVQ